MLHKYKQTSFYIKLSAHFFVLLINQEINKQTDMATFEIKMPKPGESITEGTIMSWSVKEGDMVKEDDILFEVSTAKVSVEVPSPVAGKVLKILFKENETVAVGTVVAIIELEASEGESPAASAPEAVPETKTEPAATTQSDAPTGKPATNSSGRWYSPVVLNLAKSANIGQEELDSISGTGYLGRLSKNDIQRYIEQKKDSRAVPQTKPAAPATAAPTAPAAPAVQASQAAPSIPVGKNDEVTEMDRVGRIVADHMVMSKNVSPHVTTFVEADVTKLVQWRGRTKDAFLKREGVALTYMPAIAEAVAKALTDFPKVNVSVDGYKIIWHKQINIGIAVALPDGNLIVPVVKDAGHRNLSGLAQQIDSLANKARDNKLSLDDIQGGTFTITNFGTFRNLFGTPIINQPEAAILGVGYIEKKPSVISTPEGDTIGIRHKMFLSLSYDHRVINGALGGEFLRRVADYLENWE